MESDTTLTDENLLYLIHNIFLPPKLPQKDDTNSRNQQALCEVVRRCIKMYMDALPTHERPRWLAMGKMMGYLALVQQYDKVPQPQTVDAIEQMQPDDVLAFLIRAQNAGLILRKCHDRLIVESFEVSLPNAVILGAKGKLLCSYPGPAIAVPQSIVENREFLKELVSFLAHMDEDVFSDAAAMTTKAKTTVHEIRDTTHPRYITELLTGILRGLGNPEDIHRIRKRIADDVLYHDALLPWRRSPLWLVIRVALQTSLRDDLAGHTQYKSFMSFLMAEILRLTVHREPGLPSDLISCMHKKVARRVYKLGSVCPELVLNKVYESGEAAQGLLQKRWAIVQKKQESLAPWDPNGLDFLADTHLTLLNSKSYILQVLEGKTGTSASCDFQPEPLHRIMGIDDFDKPSLTSFFNKNPIIALADFEHVVEVGIDDWVGNHLLSEEACTSVARWVKEYYEFASVAYNSDPRLWSVMLLTVFDLWKAIDQLAVAQCPLLRHYSPEVTEHLLEPLIVSKAEQMNRLSSLIRYLRGRHRHADTRKSVFDNSQGVLSFNVHFYETSLRHQELKLRIEAEAKSRREARVQELERLNEQHRSLIREADSLSHKYQLNRMGDEVHKKKKCRKCSLTRQAAALTISVHEWPLPENEMQARSVVVELDCPISYRIWRDTTYAILHDVCLPPDAKSLPKGDAKVILEGYPQLQTFHRLYGSRRVMLASDTKSFTKSHYRSVSIPSTKSSVCVNHGLHWSLFDDRGKIWIGHPFTNCSTKERCTFVLPSISPYANLQYAIDGTEHTSNQILADQMSCHRDIDLHEYVAFGSLRGGSRLQWLNLLRELHAQSLTLHKEEVQMLILQAIWQIGPLSQDNLGTPIWKWHEELSCRHFTVAILEQLEQSVTAISANWTEVISMQTLIAIVARVLISAKSEQVLDRATRLLRGARDVSYLWTRKLRQALEETMDGNLVRSLQQRLCEVACTCRSTYDVGRSNIQKFMTSDEDVSILIECGIVLYDNLPSEVEKMPSLFRTMLNHDTRLSLMIEPLLSMEIQRASGGLDTAVSAFWPGYIAGTRWKVLSGTGTGHWFTADTASGSVGRISSRVHLNILTFQLLINGKPSSRLPREFVEHPTYRRIFGLKILNVVPSDVPGLQFTTRDIVYGYQVSFALHSRENLLIIQARRMGEDLELIPYTRFEGDLPYFLVHDCVHWLNKRSNQVEFRPLETLWTSSPTNWSIKLDTGSMVMQRYYAGEQFSLIDCRSATFCRIASCLNPLETKQYLMVTFAHAPERSTLQVDLPRYRLSFALNGSQELECQSFPGMVVDRNQSIGTMLGLMNQLVLCTTGTTDGNQMDPSVCRCVLIPFGKVVHRVDGIDNVITIDMHSGRSVRYMKYNVDFDLGRLTSTASLTSRLYKVYLHALTSGCLPDPLTGWTGTEEALRDLGSAVCRSFQSLDIEDTRILDDIQRLTPHRRYYPSHLKAMQTVLWSDLPPTAQHFAFEVYSRDIMLYAESLSMFGDEAGKARQDRIIVPDGMHLTERAACRNRVFAGASCSGVEFPFMNECRDVEYHSRDCMSDTNAETRVQHVAALVKSWPGELDTCVDLLDVFKGWRTISGVRQLGETLSYSREWIETQLSETWMTLYDLCRRKGGKSNKKFQLVFTLPAIVYGPQRHSSAKDLVPILLAFASMGCFCDIPPPSSPPSRYDFTAGFAPRRDQLLHLTESCAIDFEFSLAAHLPADPGESLTQLSRRRQLHYTRLHQTESHQATEALISQWPCEQPSRPTQTFETIDIKMLTLRASPLFSSWYHNVVLRDHVAEIQVILRARQIKGTSSSSSYWFSPSEDLPRSFPDHAMITFDYLFSRGSPSPRYSVGQIALGLPDEMGRSEDESSPLGSLPLLKKLVFELRASADLTFLRNYGNDLANSLDMLSHQQPPMRKCLLTPNLAQCIMDYWDASRQHVDRLFLSIRQQLEPDAHSITADSIMLRAGLRPRITKKICLWFLTQQLRDTVPDRWRALFIDFAQALLKYQRSQRLVRSALLGQAEEMFTELRGEDDGPHTHNLDWLLIQIDSNFLAWTIQVCVAQEMIRPSSQSNTVSQLNMGEGKTSVIVPFVVSTIADGKKLARVIVLKSLAKQMFQLLVERLTGLTNRQIFYMPFSRSMKTSAFNVKQIRDLYKTCMESGGILVVQPEHILSFKLMSIERTLSTVNQGHAGVFRDLLETQRWCETNCRDILDESDEILQVRYQLIYTMGQQEALEHAPERWTTIQQVLFLVMNVALQLKNELQSGLDVGDSSNGCFPSIRVIRPEAGTRLISDVLDHISHGALPNCPLALIPNHLKEPTSCFITNNHLSRADYNRVQDYWQEGNSWKTLLLLRGLFAHGILLYILKERRWRVDYGLDLSRSLLAVPFKAKDVPTPRAEFGHPDVAILLTCMSYYYQGLSAENLELCFDLLFKLDNPTLEYELWVREGGPAIPEELRKLSGINPSDMEQRTQLVIPLFSRNHAVVDFYMSQMVFPKAAKGFPSKLTTSGWDIARVGNHVTTGFSGTNDNRYLLPATIAQRDTPERLGTNAEVLCNLLRPENEAYQCPQGLHDQQLSATSLVKFLIGQRPDVRVLLDVGAQILELGNGQVARLWLSLRPDVAAAVFFNDVDELEVMTQDGVREPFISSPFRSQLDKCLVYLDDAHTRGTDLKLPSGSRAAVTLGPKVTKDRLVQGCMRMRKLGRPGGHSVMFVAPREVDTKIREAARKDCHEQVTTLDVVRWAIFETCANIQHHVPHWVQQGIDYYAREKAWQEYHSCVDPSTSILASAWLQVEAQPLEAMYGNVDGDGAGVSLIRAGSMIPEIRERCEMLGVTSLHDPRAEEEQEREVSHEMEREWQVERPAKVKPASHRLHPDVLHFVRTGKVVSGSNALSKAFSSINEASSHLSLWSRQLLATTDFHTTTTGKSAGRPSGDYLRPVHWIVSNKCVESETRVLVIMSPYEVNELLPEIRKSSNVHLHVYTPRVTQTMRSCDDLRLYCIPPLPVSWQLPEPIIIAQLNLVAGQLYLNDYDAYQLLCDFLGLCTREVRDVGGVSIQSDGFIKPEDRPGNFYRICPFKESPLTYLKALISFRRKGMTWLPTDLGKMFHGRFLSQKDFE
ncbi:hypothetical protein NEOLEDRAFT_1060414 [Neolentinus lepideus HHB14362 ss-1]|uniref:ubiquitinyl hydrolase 1 n=1 Tax=Neolentinus lepideus HHB14362 ss-1 TaxID=1314782 RepID=A0A165U464_9AGAM|nr:hypothetical protein NEOLEDRAFT_1060414 [Neolentinus lepideus HHB14362 ss-1]